MKGLTVQITRQQARYFLVFAIGLNVGTWTQYLLVKNATKKLQEYNDWSHQKRVDLMQRMMKTITELGDSEQIAQLITDVNLFAIEMEEKSQEIRSNKWTRSL